MKDHKNKDAQSAPQNTLRKSRKDIIWRNAEFGFLLMYAAEAYWDEKIYRDHLRMLWTAYCLHFNLDVDTSGYDNDLLRLWQMVEDMGDYANPDWSDYDSFDNFMCAHLV